MTRKEKINNKGWFCVVCAKHFAEEKLYTDLGHFNDAICKGCSNTKEAKEELGIED